MIKKLTAEFLGTFWLVFGGCGSAMIAASIPQLGIGLTGISLAFGLTVLTMAYAVGPISGGHFNPAVTLGLYAAGRFQAAHLLSYILAQIAGAILAAATLFVIVTGNGNEIGNFAANGYAENSPAKYSMMAAIVTEFVLTFFFLIVILGATHKNAAPGFGGLAIGLALTLIHLISIPVTNTSVNPARSISQAIFVGDWALNQLWLFILIPCLGALVAGYLGRQLFKD